MTFAPQTLLELRAYLKTQTGLTDNELGIVGDAAHNGGYHCGKDRLVANDYSNRTSRDRSGLSLAASAIDTGLFARLREMSVWLVARCRSGAADCTDIREIIYTPDGKTVYRWDRERGVSSPPYVSGDDSHLWHTHVSYYRDSEFRSKLAPFQAFFGTGGDDMFCQFGDKNTKVQAMQLAIIRAGYDLSPVGGADSDYGNGTAAGLAHFTGDDGRTYGPVQYDKLTAAAYHGSGAPGPQGPAGPAGPAGKTPTAVQLDLSGVKVQCPVTAVS